MTPVIYLAKLLICSGIFYGYYVLALRNQPFHRFNRCYLLLSVLVSLALPLLQLSLPGGAGTAAPVAAFASQVITLREFIIPAAGTGSEPALPSVMQLLGAVYGLVTAVLLVRLLLGWKLLYGLTRKSRCMQAQGYRLVVHHNVPAPFSFFRTICWPGHLRMESREGQQILRHELAHVRGGHSADKLLMELLCVFGWMNPFFYLLRNELTMVHEFMADEQASAEEEPSGYAATILQMALQTQQHPLAHHFFHPPVARRIAMLLGKRAKYPFMKKLLIFPLAISLVIFISCQQQQDTAPREKEITAAELAKLDPQDISSMRVQRDTATGTALTIVRMKDGTIYRMQSNKRMESGPAGKGSTAGGEVFTFVENPPRFPGGEGALAKYLSDNIKYPAIAQQKGTQGTVLVQFVVNENGNIEGVRTMGGPKGDGLEEESIRVVQQMPKWNPGTQRGKAVAVQFNLPIRFTLNRK